MTRLLSSVVEHFLGKKEVVGSIPSVGSICEKLQIFANNPSSCVANNAMAEKWFVDDLGNKVRILEARRR